MNQVQAFFQLLDWIDTAIAIGKIVLMALGAYIAWRCYRRLRRSRTHYVAPTRKRWGSE